VYSGEPVVDVAIANDVEYLIITTPEPPDALPAPPPPPVFIVPFTGAKRVPTPDSLSPRPPPPSPPSPPVVV